MKGRRIGKVREPWVAAERIIEEIISGKKSDRPFLVAIDGGSGSGKSSIALALANRLEAGVVQTDDFFSASVTDDGWHMRTPEQRAADAIDWRRLKQEVLEPLRQGKLARWNAFDFAGGLRVDGTYGMLPGLKELHPGELVLIEGTYSARPELADMLDFNVLVDVDCRERHRRLLEREGKEVWQAWQARWDKAENHYFSKVRPPFAFDLVVSNR